MFDEKDDNSTGNYDSNCGGKLSVVGIGPGSLEDRTHRAERAILEASVLIGYRPYLESIADLSKAKDRRPSGMRQEMARVDEAIDEAVAGKKVALISSGDAGIYGMAGIVLERTQARRVKIAIEIVPGVTAATAAACRFGAPLMLDYATISLSDLLVPWATILHRLECVARSDLVVALYNPRSRTRTTQLSQARQVLLRYRQSSVPVGIARAMGHADQSFSLSSLGEFKEEDVDMRSIVIVGNSTTRIEDGWMFTPRGYQVGE